MHQLPLLRSQIKGLLDVPFDICQRNFKRVTRQIIVMFLKVFTALTVICLASATYEFDNHNDYPSNPVPYAFGYELQGQHGSQFRKEQGDGHGAVHGSYGFTDANGVRREVHYVADKNGFRAKVDTNEPGTGGQLAPADVQLTAHGQPGGFSAFG